MIRSRETCGCLVDRSACGGAVLITPCLAHSSMPPDTHLERAIADLRQAHAWLIVGFDAGHHFIAHSGPRHDDAQRLMGLALMATDKMARAMMEDPKLPPGGLDG